MRDNADTHTENMHNTLQMKGRTRRQSAYYSE